LTKASLRLIAGSSSGKPPSHLVVQTERMKTPQRAPLLPHEHDESARDQQPSPDKRPAQGRIDIERGLVDTDRRQDADRVFDDVQRKGPPR